MLNRTHYHHIIASMFALSAALSVTSGAISPALATPCDSADLTAGTRPCRYHAELALVADVETSFRYWTRLGLGGQPAGDVTLPSVEVEIITPTGARVCSGSFPNHPVQQSVLSVKLDARVQCTDGETLRDKFARHPALAARLCPERGNCLRPVSFGAAPYAIKAQFASWVQRANIAEQAAVAEYAHRVIANRADLLRDTLSRGYFSSQDRGQGVAYLLWSPVSASNETLHLTGRDHRHDRITWLHSIVSAAISSVLRGKLWIRGFDSDADGSAEGLSVRGDGVIASSLDVRADAGSASVISEGEAFFGLRLYDGLLVKTGVTSVISGVVRLGYDAGLPAPAWGLTLSGDLIASANATLTGRLRLSSNTNVHGPSAVGGSLLQLEGALFDAESASVNAASLQVGSADVPASATLSGGVSATSFHLTARAQAGVGPRLTHTDVTQAERMRAGRVSISDPAREVFTPEAGDVRVGSAGEPMSFKGAVRFKQPVRLPPQAQVTVTYEGCVFEEIDPSGVKIRLRCGDAPPLDLNVFMCGDGVIDLGEQCDDGNLANGDRCTDHCLCDCNPATDPGCICRADTCGDDVVNEGKEECEDGNFDTTDGCINCFNAVCGDGYVRADANPEQCDDGNEENGDGCNDACVVEAGFACRADNARSLCCLGANPANHDNDAECDDRDPDDDNDGRLDAEDSAPLNNRVCADTDGDDCDDCNSGSFDPDNDEVDPDGNQVCVGGQLNDRDGDGFSNADEVTCGSNPRRRNNRPVDTDGDGLCDNGVDADDDNDGRLDAEDSAPLNNRVCADTDGDGCDDCNSGSFDPDNDGVDPDGAQVCVGGQPGDRDGDGFSDADEQTCGSDLNDRNATPLDTDDDGLCDNGVDPDDDDDGRLDAEDNAPLNNRVCADTDGDGCDDCNSGSFDPDNDGVDPNGAQVCVGGEVGDRDGDGFSDADEQTCGSNPNGRNNTPLDTDGDGLCDNGVDPDDDNDGVADAQDVDLNGDGASLDPSQCADADGDGCDDCSATANNDFAVGANNAPANDGLDTDSDGACDLGDDDDDNDGVADAQDVDLNGDDASLDPSQCADADGDGCDDCSATANDDFADGANNAPANDGLDTDSDGACDLGDGDDDNDGVEDAQDVDLNGDDASLDPSQCADADGDGCDDCSATANDDFADGANNAPANDGLDTDSDGACDLGDVDDDGDGFHDDYETLCGADPLDENNTPADDLNGLCAQVHFAPQADPADAPPSDSDNDGYLDTYEVACGADPADLAATTPTPEADRAICPLLDLP